MPDETQGLILPSQDDFGNPIYAPTLDISQGLTPKKKTHRLEVNIGEMNFFDIEVTTERRICGGEYWIRTLNGEDYVHADDLIDFSIIDKNDVLGYFALYGLSNATGSTDFLELSKFIIDDDPYVGRYAYGYYKQCFEGIKGTSLLIPGLHYRVQVDSNYVKQTGDSDTFRLVARMYYYE